MDVRAGLQSKLSTKELMLFKNWCFSQLMLEKIPASPLDCKEIKPVNPKGNQSWIFTGRTEAEAPILWPPDAKNWVIGKDPNAGKDWRWEKGMTEDEMVGWRHWLDGHEFEQTPEVGDGQGSLVSCSPWGCKESDTTEQLNWTEPSHGSRRSNPDHRIISTKKLIHPKAGNACLPGESRIIAEFKN